MALRGNVHPNANPLFDAGPVDPLMKLDHVLVMLKPSAAQQADLDQLLAEQQDRSSRNYHAWLTPEQFGDRFGASPNDVGQVVSWLQSEGLAVDEVSRARTWIWFSGTAGQMRAALRTEIRRYNVAGELHFANSTEPSVPAAIEPFVIGIQGLDDFLPRSRQSVRALNSVAPQFTSSLGNHFLAPDDFATIYNLKPLYAAGYDGSGQRIVVAGQSTVDLADIRTFRNLYGLPQNDPQIVLVPGSVDPGKTSAMGEAALDIEWAGAVARKASIIYVYSTDVLRISVPYAINHNLASIITYSFGLCEQLNSSATLSSTRALAQQANAQGITWVASSGDSGAAGCDPHADSTNPIKTTKASFGLGVSLPASLPEVTAVGGTQFDDAGGAYWATLNSTTLASALSYIPEKGWNESDASGLSSSGGGLSVTFPKPWWQAGPGVPDANFRAVPDVSLSAAGHDGYRVISEGLFFVDSGTSAAAPSFAGILALVNQYQELNFAQTGSGQGNINPNLYSLARNTSGVFHDVINGDNIVPCIASSPDCMGGTLGYTAGPGYDLVTGLGSVDGFNLAVALTTQWNTPAISHLSPESVIAGGANFTLAVNGSGFDAGSVVLWLGTPLPTTFVNRTQLLATVSSVLFATPGTAAITVQASGGISAPITLAIVPSFGATFGVQRVTTTAPPASGCVLPPAVSSFGATDTVFLYFTAVVTSNDLLTREWIAPNGVVAASGSYGPQSGNICFVSASLNLGVIQINPVGVWQVRVYDHGSLLFSVPFTVTVAGNQTTPLAHAADGNAFKTTVLLTNAGSTPAPYTLRFNDDNGNLPSTRFELETGSLTGIIPAGGSATIRTAGLGPATVNGWAELTAPASVGGSVIYSQKNPKLPSVQEGTATIGTSASQHFFLPFDNTNKAATGVAFTNPGATAANNIHVTFHYSDGTTDVTTLQPLAGRNHRAFALSVPDKKGVAEVTSDAALLTVVFRANSTGAFTALDAVTAGTVPITRTLAHAADGNAFKTTVLLTNAGSVPATYTLRFNDDQGHIPATRFELDTGSDPLTGAIPAGGSVTIRTAGFGPETVFGWAELTAPASVGGSVIYSQQVSRLPTLQEGTATIVASGSNHFFLPFDNTAGGATGVAITNPDPSLASNISITFRYSDGTTSVSSLNPLASRNHTAFALSAPGKQGVAELTSNTPLYTVVFRANSTGALTSLGVVAAP
ncbi:MAG: S8 family serine peptidase [Acidobacteriia bacterium]|nr:S8 family serine peptidase [Terriglobia bacterium]